MAIKTEADVKKFLQERTIEAQKNQDKDQKNQDQQTAKKPVQMFLPGLEETKRAMPNHIARSSLFAPVARGRRKHHRRTILVSRADVTIDYTGTQLDEAQSDVWMHLVFLARNTPLGDPVAINRAALLKAIGRRVGGNDYKWLHNAMFDFTAATIVIEAKRKDGSSKYRIGNTEAFHMLSSFKYTEETEIYTFTIDPRWKALFNNREYALLDWPKRLQIARGQDLSKALQRQFATSNETTQRFALDRLRQLMQYTSPMRKFKRDALPKALDELKRLEIVDSWLIEESTKGKEQLVVFLVEVSG